VTDPLFNPLDMQRFAGRIRAVVQSNTTRMFELANELREHGRRIINLAVGEPDFDTPWPIIEATRAALENQATRYGPVAGLPALRRALADKVSGYGPENILITNGAKQGLYALFQVLCDPGTEIILPRPCWVSFTEQIKLAGGRPVLVDTIDHPLDPQAIKQAITPATRAIVVNSPNNPTGAVYDADALRAVVRLAEAHDLLVISDEAYQEIYYDDRVPVPLITLAEDPGRIITVRSFSKHYNMTGYRIGYVMADPEVIRLLARHQGHTTGNVCTFAQHGALAALTMDQTVVSRRRALLARRRDLAYQYVHERFPCEKPRGAFYLFPDATSRLRPGETSSDLALRILETAGVAVVPGDAFHGPGHIRISYAVSEELLHEAFEKMRKLK
jgi:aspartate aminotransferase